MSRLTIRAFAKINLNLRILGRRADGHHDIESVLQTITLHDTIVLEAASRGIDLRVEGDVLPSDRTNLVRRAAEAMREESGAAAGVRIHLKKRIPWGSGLGGGSSDAAATLLGLNRLWAQRMSAERMGSLAERLGADVPFFLLGGTARVRGRGEEVEALPDPPPRELLVVYPGRSLSTAEVYAQPDEPLTPAAGMVNIPYFGCPPEGQGIDALMGAGNDLESRARRLCPEIGEVKDRLKLAGATGVAMTGSGSAVFGLFPSGALRDRAARDLTGRGWELFRCAPLGRGEYRRSHRLS